MTRRLWPVASKLLSIALLVLLMGVVRMTVAGAGPPISDAIWVDGDLFGTVPTPSTLPDKGPKDGIYSFGQSGLNGQRSVAEAKPGDKDYNGGRWQVYFVEFTELGKSIHDPDGDGTVNFELTSWEQVKEHIDHLGHLVVLGPGPSFVCPLTNQGK